MTVARDRVAAGKPIREELPGFVRADKLAAIEARRVKPGEAPVCKRCAYRKAAPGSDECHVCPGLPRGARA